jgi:hypothetical protein
MANNITVKDALGNNIVVRTVEESTSAHLNMSIPINVSGLPIFTTAAPGLVCVAGSIPIAGTVDVSISPNGINIPVSVAGGSITATIADNAPVSVRGGNINAIQSGVWNVNASVVGQVSVAPQTLTVHVCNQFTVSVADKVSVGGIVGVQAGTALIGGVSVRQIVSVQPDGTANWPVSIAGTPTVNIGAVTGNIGVSIGGQTGNIGVSVINPTFNLPVSVHPVTQSGTWTVQPGNTANTTPWLVSVGGNVSITDNAPVSVRGGVLGAVSLGGGTAQIGSVVNAAGTNLIGAVSVRQIVSVQPDGTANWPVSIAPPTFNLPVSIAGTPTVGLAAGTNLIGAVSVRGSIIGAVSIANIADVSISPAGLNIPVSIAPPTFNVPVSIASGRVSVQGISQVSVTGLVTVDAKSNTGAAAPAGAFFVGGTDGTNLRGLLTDTAGRLVVHVSNTAPGGAAGSTQMVSIGGAVSLQAVQIGVRDTAGDARTPLANTGGNLLVHVCNALPTVSGITQLVSVAGPVSTQAVQVAFTDGTNARTPLTNTGGNILVHVCNAAPGAAGGSSITVSVGGAVSNQAVPVAFRDTGGDARQPLLTTGGIQLVHVCNAAPGGGSGGGSPQVSIGGAVSNQATQVAAVDVDGNARTIHTNVSGVQYISTRTFMSQATLTRPADTTAYAAGTAAAPGAAGDLIANSTTAGSVVPLKFRVSRGNDGVAYIRGARLYRTGGGLAAGQHNIAGAIRLHLFNAATGTSVGNGDNGALLASPVSNWMGYIDLTPIASAPGLRTSGNVSVQVYWGVPARTGEMIVPLAATQVSIQGLLETRVAFTPIASEVFTVQIDGFNG